MKFALATIIPASFQIIFCFNSFTRTFDGFYVVSCLQEGRHSCDFVINHKLQIDKSNREK